MSRKSQLLTILITTFYELYLYGNFRFHYEFIPLYEVWRTTLLEKFSAIFYKNRFFRLISKKKFLQVWNTSFFLKQAPQEILTGLYIKL